MATEGTGAIHARGLGDDGGVQGWKVSPSIRIEPGETRVLAEIKGAGAIQQIWMTSANLRWRDMILRIYWDDQEQPSVECPLGDFFCCGWNRFAQVTSLAVCVNPGRAFNCYWEMPFRKARADHASRTATRTNHGIIYYQINYTLTDVPEDAAYFHAQFRRTNPLPYKERLHDPRRRRRAAATTSAPTWPGASTIPAGGARARSSSSWTATASSRPSAAPAPRTISAAPTISTAASSTTPWTAATGSSPRPMPACRRSSAPTAPIVSQQRFGMYRWHITDPIRFESDLRVTIQALGWRTEKEDRRYLPLQDDIASVAFWYQTLPTAPFPALPDRDYLEII